MAVSFYNPKTKSWQSTPTSGSGITSSTSNNKTTKYNEDSSIKEKTSKKKSSSEQTYKPTTQKTIQQIQSGEIKADDPYIVNGEVAVGSIKTKEGAKITTAEILQEAKNQEIERKAKVASKKRRQAMMAAYGSYVKEQVTSTYNIKKKVAKGELKPTLIKTPDPVTGALTPAIGYSVPYEKEYTSLSPYQKVTYTGTKIEKIEYKTKPYIGALFDQNPKYTPFAKSQKDYMFSQAALKSGAEYVEQRPLRVAAVVGVGAATGGLAAGIASLGTGGATLTAVAGGAMGGYYVGAQTTRVVVGGEPASKVVGESMVDVAAFGKGARMGGKAVLNQIYKPRYTTKAKTYFTQQETTLNRPLTVEMNQKSTRAYLDTKQFKTTTQNKATVTIYETKGFVGRDPIKLTSIQPTPKTFSDVYITGKIGKYSVVGKTSGGKTSPRTTTMKYFEGDKFLYSTTTKSKPINLYPKKTLSTDTAFFYRSQKGDIINTLNIKTGLSTGAQSQTKMLRRIDESISIKQTNQVEGYFRSSSLVTRSKRQVLFEEGGYNYDISVSSKPVKIEFGKEYSNPPDVTRITRDDFLIDNYPVTTYNIKAQRGGLLFSNIRRTQAAELYFKYDRSIDLSKLRMNKRASVLSSKQLNKPTRITVPKSEIQAKMPKSSKFDLTQTQIGKQINIPKKTPHNLPLNSISTKSDKTTKPQVLNTTFGIKDSTLPKIKSFYMSNLGTKQNISTKLITNIKTKPVTTTTFNTKLAQRNNQITSIITPFSIGGGGGFSRIMVPPPPPPLPGLFDLNLPLATGGGWGKKYASKRAFEYKPDIAAVFSGKKRKRKLSNIIWTGLERRYI